jgi:hypothetical protein
MMTSCPSISIVSYSLGSMLFMNVCDGAKFKNKLTGDMVYFQLAEENEQISHAP